jgi:hypothetical protein
MIMIKGLDKGGFDLLEGSVPSKQSPRHSFIHPQAHYTASAADIL